jgi:hypothetical protein
MLTAEERDALLSHTEERSWSLVRDMVVAAMEGDASRLKLVATGPGTCVQMLVPAADPLGDPSLSVIIDRTHHTPAIIVIGDRTEAETEYSDIIDFAWRMHGSGRLPAHVDQDLTRWREH